MEVCGALPTHTQENTWCLLWWWLWKGVWNALATMGKRQILKEGTWKREPYAKIMLNSQIVTNIPSRNKKYSTELPCISYPISNREVRGSWANQEGKASSWEQHTALCLWKKPLIGPSLAPRLKVLFPPLLSANHCFPSSCFFFTNPLRLLLCHKSVPSLWQLNLPGKEAS